MVIKLPSSIGRRLTKLKQNEALKLVYEIEDEQKCLKESAVPIHKWMNWFTFTWWVILRCVSILKDMSCLSTTSNWASRKVV